MATRKLITVFGATGMQGGAVVDALLPAGYDVRGVTRKPDDAKAKALRARGVQVVAADMVTDSVEKLAETMKGAYGAFLLTNFWDPASMMKEEPLGKKLVDAAKAAGVKHVFWSTLANVEAISGNKGVPHFTDKAKVEEYIRSLQAKSPKAFQYATYSAPAFYYQNFKAFFPPKKEGDTLVFSLPETSNLIAFDVNQTGPGVVTALNHPEKWDGVRIDYYGDKLTPQQYIDALGKFTGQKVKLNSIPRDVFGKLGFPGAEEFAHTFQWFNDFTYYGPQGNPKTGIDATPGGLLTWSQYLQRYGFDI